VLGGLQRDDLRGGEGSVREPGGGHRLSGTFDNT